MIARIRIVIVSHLQISLSIYPPRASERLVSPSVAILSQSILSSAPSSLVSARKRLAYTSLQNVIGRVQIRPIVKYAHSLPLLSLLSELLRFRLRLTHFFDSFLPLLFDSLLPPFFDRILIT